MYTADRDTLASLTGFELTRGVLCAFRRPLPRSVEEVCRNARRVAVQHHRTPAALGHDAFQRQQTVGRQGDAVAFALQQALGDAAHGDGVVHHHGAAGAEYFDFHCFSPVLL